MSNLPLLTIGDYYNYSHDKNGERKMEIEQRYGMGYGGCDELCLAATGLSLVTLFSLSVSIEDRPLLWMVVRSQTYYPEHILAYGSGKARYALVVGSLFFGPTDWRRKRWRSKHHIETRSQVWGLGVQVWIGTWTP